MREQLLEVIARMAKGEAGLHTKVVGAGRPDEVKVVRLNTLPLLLREDLARQVKSKKWVKHKTIQQNGHSICVLRRPV